LAEAIPRQSKAAGSGASVAGEGGAALIGSNQRALIGTRISGHFCGDVGPFQAEGSYC
jgi:hypothetical protein